MISIYNPIIISLQHRNLLLTYLKEFSLRIEELKEEDKKPGNRNGFVEIKKKEKKKGKKKEM